MSHWSSIKLPILMVIVLLSACGQPENEDVVIEQVLDNSQEVQDYYASKPEFFSFKTLADLPADLNWDDGMDMPDLGSPEATKGGTQYGALQDFPRTLRIVGPDSNGSFRPFILDNVVMQLAHKYPNDQNKYFPGLATSWAISTERKTTYMKLNPDATWSDGEKVTADDYLFAFFLFQSET